MALSESTFVARGGKGWRGNQARRNSKWNSFQWRCQGSWVTSPKWHRDRMLLTQHHGVCPVERGGWCPNVFLSPLNRFTICMHSTEIVQRLIIWGILESVQTKPTFQKLVFDALRRDLVSQDPGSPQGFLHLQDGAEGMYKRCKPQH